MKLSFSIGEVSPTGRINEKNEEILCRAVEIHEQEYGLLNTFHATFTPATEKEAVKNAELHALKSIKRLKEYARVAELVLLRNSLSFNLIKNNEEKPRIRMREVQCELSELHEAFVTLSKVVRTGNVQLSNITVEWVLKNMTFTEYAPKSARKPNSLSRFESNDLCSTTG